MKRKFVESYHHTFTRCFSEKESTETVYDEAVKPLVIHAMLGGKSVIMMYVE